jgi:hypothetical protein
VVGSVLTDRSSALISATLRRSASRTTCTSPNGLGRWALDQVCTSTPVLDQPGASRGRRAAAALPAERRDEKCGQRQRRVPQRAPDCGDVDSNSLSTMRARRRGDQPAADVTVAAHARSRRQPGQPASWSCSRPAGSGQVGHDRWAPGRLPAGRVGPG